MNRNDLKNAFNDYINVLLLHNKVYICTDNTIHSIIKHVCASTVRVCKCHTKYVCLYLILSSNKCKSTHGNNLSTYSDGLNTSVSEEIPICRKRYYPYNLNIHSIG